MQYFMALKVGQKRVNDAREYLNKFANGKAMPALALKDNKTNIWEPVGKKICMQLSMVHLDLLLLMMADTFLCYVIKMELRRRLYKDCLMKKRPT